MKQYFKNLWRAIIGKDPTYRADYLKQVVETEAQRKQVNDFKNLTENYRATITDKEKSIYALREDLRETLDQLQKANRNLAKEVMAQSMLEKTNLAVKDLLSAIESDDIDKLKSCLQWLDWNAPLVQVANRYISLRMRLDEVLQSSEDENPNHD